MKSKFKFFGIVALISVAAFTVQSCAKDFSEDIDDIKAQLAAAQASITSLQGAINAGKLVKTVANVTNGYTITFSDNSTITILNGATGAPGQVGPAGFTPIIGIDAQGYWTVIATQGATATRILVGGQPVLAKVTAQNLTLGTDNYLYVDGVKSSVFIPNIYYNSVDRTLSVWIMTSGTLTEYKLPLANDVVLQSDIVGLVSPVAETKVLVNYGMVLNYGQTTAQLNWANVTLDQLLLPVNAKLPVIVNPANATVDGYTFEIITADGTAIPIQGTISAGWTGDFVQYTTGENGLYTLTLAPTAANIQSFITMFAAPTVAPGPTTAIAEQLAVRAVKGTRQITSGYQYAVKVDGAEASTLSYDGETTNYVQIPSNTNLLTEFFEETEADFYKVGTVKVSADANLADYLTSSLSSPNVSVVQGGTSEDIDSYRAAVYTVKTMDFTGKYQEQNVPLTFYTPLTLANVPEYTASYTIGGTAPAAISLTDLLTALDGERKLELWRANADIAGFTGVPPGVTAKAYMADGTTEVTTAKDLAKVKFTFTNSTVVPGTYTIYLTFNDTRPAVTDLYTEFKVKFTLTVSNPDLASVLSSFVHVPTPMWSGQLITLYGNSTSESYNLRNAYVNFSSSIPASYSTVFKLNGTTALPGSNLDRYNYDANRVNVTNNVALKLRVFGNPDNEVLIETIQVLLLSEIQQGSVVATQTGGVDNFLSVTHGSTTWKYFDDVYSLKDYLGNSVNAFDTNNPDSRLASYPGGITIAASGPNAGLIDIDNYGYYNDHFYRFRVRSHYSYDDPILTQASVDVPVAITVTDDFGKTLVKNIVVRVVKP